MAVLSAGRGWPRTRASASDGLAAIAASRGLLYGAAAKSSSLVASPELASAYARECGMLVPEVGLKWQALRPDRDTFDFSDPDWLLRFAADHGLRFRGHTLIWYKALPAWVEREITPGNAESLLRQHFTTVIGHYRGRMHSWDVVNEGLDAHSDRSDGLRRSIWLENLGPEYIALAFHVAHEIDPAAMLVYNENEMDDDRPPSDRKRGMVLDLLGRLRSAGVPVAALGVQAHLRAGQAPFAATKVRDFLRQISGLGLKIIVSELDVSDRDAAGPMAERDQAVAAVYGDYLSAALDERGVVAVVTWGLSDQDSWLNSRLPRDSNRRVRPLPLDDTTRRKPAWHAIAAAFAAAPVR